MQSELRFTLFEKSGSETHFAHLVQSVNGLRFAQLNSQQAGAPPGRRSPLRHRTALTPRINHGDVTCRSPASQSFAGRRMLRPTMLLPTKFVRFGHQRPNPSVERTAKGLRPSSAAHLER